MEMSERVLREIFLPPWEAGIKKSGALGVMLTYPAIDGVPSHASSKLVKGILREETRLPRPYARRRRGISTLVHEHVAGVRRKPVEIALRAGLDVGISLEAEF